MEDEEQDVEVCDGCGEEIGFCECFDEEPEDDWSDVEEDS